jgi:cytosine/adenosine deaminase-related metal-dependent hydrolase
MNPKTIGHVCSRLVYAFHWRNVGSKNRHLARRYLAAKMRATLRVIPNALGLLPADESAYERNNRWMLESAARFGDNKIAFISLWNSQGGDGPGGAHHFMADVRRKTARIYWLDTRKLWD